MLFACPEFGSVEVCRRLHTFLRTLLYLSLNALQVQLETLTLLAQLDKVDTFLLQLELGWRQ